MLLDVWKVLGVRKLVLGVRNVFLVYNVHLVEALVKGFPNFPHFGVRDIKSPP